MIMITNRNDTGADTFKAELDLYRPTIPGHLVSPALAQEMVGGKMATDN